MTMGVTHLIGRRESRHVIHGCLRYFDELPNVIVGRRLRGGHDKITRCHRLRPTTSPRRQHALRSVLSDYSMTFRRLRFYCQPISLVKLFIVGFCRRDVLEMILFQSYRSIQLHIILVIIIVLLSPVACQCQIVPSGTADSRCQVFNGYNRQCSSWGRPVDVARSVGCNTHKFLVRSTTIPT